MNDINTNIHLSQTHWEATGITVSPIYWALEDKTTSKHPNPLCTCQPANSRITWKLPLFGLRIERDLKTPNFY